MKNLARSLPVIIILITGCSNTNPSDSGKEIRQISTVNESFEIAQVDFKLPSNPDPKILSQAYGYLKGQQFTLSRIKKEYPSLELEVTKCELEFSLAFKKASENITNQLKELFGSEFDNYESEMMTQLKSLLSQQKITEDLAINFIEEVKQRAKGNIESPVLQPLLTYQFIDNPSKEFSSGFTTTYSTKGHTKSKNVEINAKFPNSWNQQEGDRPNVIQKFVSENGKGQEIILFMVKDLGLPTDYKVTEEELSEFFVESKLKQMIPDGSEFISAKKITLDKQIGGQIIFKTTAERLDFTITMQAIHFITIYDGKMVFLQCMVSAEQGENLNDRFNLFLPLFRQVANSLVLMDQY